MSSFFHTVRSSVANYQSSSACGRPHNTANHCCQNHNHPLLSNYCAVSPSICPLLCTWTTPPATNSHTLSFEPVNCKYFKLRNLRDEQNMRLVTPWNSTLLRTPLVSIGQSNLPYILKHEEITRSRNWSLISSHINPVHTHLIHFYHTIPQVVEKFPAFYGTRRFFTMFTTAGHCSLSWARLTHCNLSYSISYCNPF